jgi:hypothetical protein
MKILGKLFVSLTLLSPLLLTRPAMADGFTVGDIVISTVSGTGTLDAASPLVLQSFTLGAGGTSMTADGSLTLPQTASGNNSVISGEYGSASEGILQLSSNGHYLTIMGYGVNANTFNTAPLSTYGSAALGQTSSLLSGTVTTVPRVVALIGADGSVDTTTALTGVFNMNNPRSVATVDGSSFYVSGQGQSGDGTGGLFYTTLGATTATPINNNTLTSFTGANSTANPSIATETRVVEIVNTSGTNQLQASRDFKVSGTPNDATDIRSFTDSTGALPTGTTGLVVTRVTPNKNSTNGGNTSSIDLTSSLANGVNNSRIGKFVYLSPEQFFYANATTLYIADSGQPKNGSSGAAADGEGGLQKWILSGTTWTLAYDLVNGLSLVSNTTANSNTPTAPGVTGLFALTGTVTGTAVQLFATSYGLNELSPSSVYEITDNLNATSISQVGSEAFTTLLTDTTGQTLYRGISFAPTVAAVPEPQTWALLVAGFGALVCFKKRRCGDNSHTKQTCRK